MGMVGGTWVIFVCWWIFFIFLWQNTKLNFIEVLQAFWFFFLSNCPMDVTNLETARTHKPNTLWPCSSHTLGVLEDTVKDLELPLLIRPPPRSLAKLAAKKQPKDRNHKLLKITLGQLCMPSEFWRSHLSPFGKVAKSWQSDPGGEVLMPFLLLSSLSDILFSFIRYPNTIAESVDLIRKPAWCCLGWQDKGVHWAAGVSGSPFLYVPPLLCPGTLLSQGEPHTHKAHKLLGLQIWDASQRSSFSSTHVAKEAKRESHLPRITDRCENTGAGVPLLITETGHTDLVPCLLDPVLSLHMHHLTVLAVKQWGPVHLPFYRWGSWCSEVK